MFCMLVFNCVHYVLFIVMFIYVSYVCSVLGILFYCVVLRIVCV
jgi:hypothetical protein